jgi:hypothetical protein
MVKPGPLKFSPIKRKAFGFAREKNAAINLQQINRGILLQVFYSLWLIDYPRHWFLPQPEGDRLFR